MRYVYVKDMCSACEEKKKEFDSQGIDYIIREASRLENSGWDTDEIDKTAFAQLAMQNNVFPVWVER